MTRTQRAVLIAGFLAVAVSGLWVPWLRMMNSGEIMDRGYGLWGLPPVTRIPGFWRIDYRQLGLSWLVIAALTGGVYLALGFRRRTSPTDGEGSSK